jgi:hypothetical protein
LYFGIQLYSIIFYQTWSSREYYGLWVRALLKLHDPIPFG